MNKICLWTFIISKINIYYLLILRTGLCTYLFMNFKFASILREEEIEQNIQLQTYRSLDFLLCCLFFKLDKPCSLGFSYPLLFLLFHSLNKFIDTYVSYTVA